MSNFRLDIPFNPELKKRLRLIAVQEDKSLTRLVKELIIIGFQHKYMQKSSYSDSVQPLPEQPKAVQLRLLN